MYILPECDGLCGDKGAHELVYASGVAALDRQSRAWIACLAVALDSAGPARMRHLLSHPA